MAQDMAITGYALPLSEGGALALRGGWRQRVLIYITRSPSELLVFEQPAGYPFPDAGVQVPAGGLDAGETPDQTAMRETFEETGLQLQNPAHLASYHWTRGETSQIWHYFSLLAPSKTPDTWAHTVTGGESDSGMVFQCRFAPLGAHGLIAGFHYEEALPQLKNHLNSELTLLQAQNPSKENRP